MVYLVVRLGKLRVKPSSKSYCDERLNHFSCARYAFHRNVAYIVVVSFVFVGVFALLKFCRTRDRKTPSIVFSQDDI